MEATAAPGRARLDALLRGLGIAVQEATHAPVFRVADGRLHDLPGAECKNLLLRDAKAGLFLVTLRADRRADLKALPALLGARRLSFASAETLREVLGVTPGAVTPLALVNDTGRRVTFALDAALARAERIVCHPLVNTASLSIATADLLRLLAALEVRPHLLALDGATHEGVNQIVGGRSNLTGIGTEP